MLHLTWDVHISWIKSLKALILNKHLQVLIGQQSQPLKDDFLLTNFFMRPFTC